MTPNQRLFRIAEILENVDRRCEVADGPVTKTQEEITAAEMLEIYRLAKGKARR